MHKTDAENLLRNPALAGAPAEHGLPEGWTLNPYSHGVHYWEIPVPVEAHVDILPQGGPDGRAAIRVEHQAFRLLEPWDDYLPTPGVVKWVGIRPDVGNIPPEPFDRLFELVYRGRSEGGGFVHARIKGLNLQNDPESIAWTDAWRRIEHVFILEADKTLDGVFFYVKVPEPGDAVEVSGVLLRSIGAFRPTSLKPRSQLQKLPEPNRATEIHVNPPTLAWMSEGEDARYELELSPTEDFSHDVRRHAPLNFNFFKLPELLPPGDYFWRWRRTDDDFSRPIAFTMPEGCVEYVTPTFEEIFAGLRRDHPRLMTTKDTLNDFRRMVLEDNAESWQRFLERIDRAWRPRHGVDPADEGYRIAITCNRLWNHAFAWLVTGETAHAETVRELLHEVLAVPCEGRTTHRHSELSRNLVTALSMGYDALYDVLTDDERTRTREAIARRVDDIYRFYRVDRHPWHSYERFRYDSHGTYMMQTILNGALTIADEVPEAKRWMEYWLMLSISFYPPWSETDGSWAQGVLYGSSYVDHNDITEAIQVRSATGLNLFEKPFFRQHRDYLLYACPPFGAKVPFGDVSVKDRMRNTDRKRFTRIARTLAYELNDPYAKWYAETGEAETERRHRVRVLVPRARHVTAKPPTDLPLAKCFPDTGWVLMHTDLTSEDDVFCAFKSSPYGSISHSHADQNSFVLSVGPHRLLTDSGYYAGYGTPHHLGWTKQSKAHNTILVDGRGQLVNSIKAAGHVTHFAHTAEIDYTVGDAQAAYGNRLERFDRHVVFLRPNLFVLFDDIVATEPGTVDWLLHAPEPFRIDEDARTVETENGPACARVHLFEPDALAFSVTDRFDPPPPVRKSTWTEEVYRDEHHFTARTATPAKETRFVAVIGVGESTATDSLPEPSWTQTDSWLGVETDTGSAFFRKGSDRRVTVAGREIETDARTLVLRSSGAYLAADVSRLTVDGQTLFESEDVVKVHTGRLD